MYYLNLILQGGSMGLRRFFSALFPPSIPDNSEVKRSKLIRGAVARTATGNVLLQFGRYRTEADIAKLKELALSIKYK
jgi:hypothetical protein